MRKPPRSGHKGGSHLCATCNHPEREAIDAALVAYSPSLFVLEKKYGIDHTSLSRHRTNHISKALVALRPALPADATTLQRLEAQRDRVERFFTEAEKRGHSEQLTTLSRELRLLTNDIAKAKGEKDAPPPVGINIQTSPEWIAIRAIVWEELAAYPAVRVAIGKRLLALDGESKT